jgi:hypothetical protein
MEMSFSKRGFLDALPIRQRVMQRTQNRLLTVARVSFST